jgi:glycine cleavage system aminomethyltransferase T
MSGDINGIVTSGNISPVLGHPIGYILFETNPSDNLVEFDIRGNLIEGNLLSKRFLS